MDMHRTRCMKICLAAVSSAVAVHLTQHEARVLLSTANARRGGVPPAINFTPATTRPEPAPQPAAASTDKDELRALARKRLAEKQARARADVRIMWSQPSAPKACACSLQAQAKAISPKPLMTAPMGALPVSPKVQDRLSPGPKRTVSEEAKVLARQRMQERQLAARQKARDVGTGTSSPRSPAPGLRSPVAVSEFGVGGGGTRPSSAPGSGTSTGSRTAPMSESDREEARSRVQERQQKARVRYGNA